MMVSGSAITTVGRPQAGLRSELRYFIYPRRVQINLALLMSPEELPLPGQQQPHRACLPSPTISCCTRKPADGRCHDRHPYFFRTKFEHWLGTHIVATVRPLAERKGCRREAYRPRCFSFTNAGPPTTKGVFYPHSSEAIGTGSESCSKAPPLVSSNLRATTHPKGAKKDG